MNNDLLPVEEDVSKGGVPYRLLAASVVAGSLILAGTWLYVSKSAPRSAEVKEVVTDNSLLATVTPTAGVELPVSWAGVGKKLAQNGVIDAVKLREVYASRGGVSRETADILAGSEAKIKITRENSAELLNVLWALGLGNKSQVLETGPIQDPRYGGAGGFASTGGWTLAKGDPMDHFSHHRMVVLDEEGEAKVARVAKGIYRPCCNNATHFPDCNHGMAMLGLLELMAAQGSSEEDMYKAALAVNSFWFPDTYLASAKLLAANGIAWKDAEPKLVLGLEYSSGRGAANVRAQVSPVEQNSGGGCAV